MAFNKAADREGAPMKRRPMHRRKKVCVFCVIGFFHKFKENGRD